MARHDPRRYLTDASVEETEDFHEACRSSPLNETLFYRLQLDTEAIAHRRLAVGARAADNVVQNNNRWPPHQDSGPSRFGLAMMQGVIRLRA